MASQGGEVVVVGGGSVGMATAYYLARAGAPSVAVEGAGHAVVAEVRVQELAAGVDHLLVEGVPEPQHHRTLVMALASHDVDLLRGAGIL
jgi:2-polyprenyl-6-methoxyphenol hydroxylase-like FAD-dependent oxidoreductase